MVNSYRLDEYKIMDSGMSELTWQSHVGFGAFREGRCFRKGSILFIGPPETFKPGFLKGEFIDHLKRLPAWQKTPYYCTGCEVYHCSTGDKVTKKDMLAWTLEGDADADGRYEPKPPPDRPDTTSGSQKTTEANFRLQRYEIVRKATGQFGWLTQAGPNLVYSGNCIVLEDILFIQAFQSIPSGLDKRSFIANLRRLPMWDRTRYYSPKVSLLDCKSGCRVSSTGNLPKDAPLAETKRDAPNQKRATAVTFSKERAKRLSSRSISHILDAIFRSTANIGDGARSSCSKGARHILKIIAGIRTAGARRWLRLAVALILLTGSILVSFLIGFWDDFREKSHHKKSEHRSGHHRDH